MAPGRADKGDDNSSDEGGLKVGHCHLFIYLRQTESIWQVPSPALEPPLLADVKATAANVPALPELPPTDDSDKGTASPAPLPPPPKEPEDEFAALAKRFEALKRR